MLVSPPSSKNPALERRKGGGGGGKGGGGSGGGSSGAKGSSSGSSASGGSGSRPVSVSGLPSSSRGASAFGTGGGKPITIPPGQLFAGRTSGGATRNQIFGSPIYGSGYPNQPSRSVVGRSFPFGFWPIVWGGSAIAGIAYLNSDSEYGRPDNSSRPGGSLVLAPLMQLNDNTTYHIISDNATAVSLLQSLQSSCPLSTNSTVLQPFNPNNASDPQPQQAIQYYRASSIVLTLDGYTNNATNGSDPNAPNTPLPNGLNTTFLDCLNQTIGNAAPILDDATRLSPLPILLVWLLYWLVKTNTPI